MNLAEVSPAWLIVLLALLLLAAAGEDFRRLTIPNLLCASILAAAVVAALIAGPETRLWQNLAVLAALLAVGTALFSWHVLGGGDVKLLAATGSWFDIEGALRLLFAVAIAGGALALLLLLARKFKWSEATRASLPALQKRGGIPYGVAIAAGALVAIVS